MTQSHAIAVFLVTESKQTSQSDQRVGAWAEDTNGTYYDGLNCYVLRADTITETLATSAKPLPAALPLFATGLGALGLLGWRRKRKAAAALAA